MVLLRITWKQSTHFFDSKQIVNLVKNEGKIHLDVGLKLNRTEIASALNLWSIIGNTNDFDIQWRHFLLNLESVIS